MKKIKSAALALSLSLVLSSCSSVDKIINAMENKEYDEALSTFDESELNDDEKTKLCEELTKQIEEGISAYANNDMELDELNRLIDTAYKMNVGDILSFVAQSRKKINDLFASKQSFENGMNYYSEGDFIYAYQSFSKVSEEDAYYEEAKTYLTKSVKGYCDTIDKAVNDYVLEDNYDNAISLLEQERYRCDFSDEAKEFIENSLSELIVPSTISKAKNYVKEEKFYSAFTLLSDTKSKYGLENNSEIKNCEAEITAELKNLIKKQTDDLISAGKYEDAEANLNSWSSTASANDELKAFWNETYEALKIRIVLSKADEYVKSDDIAAALTEISTFKEENNIKENKELDDYTSDISKEYINLILERISALREKENYILALKILDDARAVIDAPEFTKQIEEINAVKPIYLYDLKCTTSSRFQVMDSGEQPMDSVGNRYELGNLFEMSADGGSWSSEGASAEYNLGYRYKTMSGTIAVDDISDNATVTFKIEGDDVLLYSFELSRTITPTPFSIDVSNVNWLRISLVDPHGGVIYALLSDFRFSKDNSAQSVQETSAEVQETPEESTEGTSAESTEEAAETTDEQ